MHKVLWNAYIILRAPDIAYFVGWGFIVYWTSINILWLGILLDHEYFWYHKVVHAVFLVRNFCHVSIEACDDVLNDLSKLLDLLCGLLKMPFEDILCIDINNFMELDLFDFIVNLGLGHFTLCKALHFAFNHHKRFFEVSDFLVDFTKENGLKLRLKLLNKSHHRVAKTCYKSSSISIWVSLFVCQMLIDSNELHVKVLVGLDLRETNQVNYDFI